MQIVHTSPYSSHSLYPLHYLSIRFVRGPITEWKTSVEPVHTASCHVPRTLFLRWAPSDHVTSKSRRKPLLRSDILRGYFSHVATSQTINRPSKQLFHPHSYRPSIASSSSSSVERMPAVVRRRQRRDTENSREGERRGCENDAIDGQREKKVKGKGKQERKRKWDRVVESCREFFFFLNFIFGIW